MSLKMVESISIGPGFICRTSKLSLPLRLFSLEQEIRVEDAMHTTIAIFKNSLRIIISDFGTIGKARTLPLTAELSN
jgi:hypothetical protein